MDWGRNSFKFDQFVGAVTQITKSVERSIDKAIGIPDTEQQPTESGQLTPNAKIKDDKINNGSSSANESEIPKSPKKSKRISQSITPQKLSSQFEWSDDDNVSEGKQNGTPIVHQKTAEVQEANDNSSDSTTKELTTNEANNNDENTTQQNNAEDSTSEVESPKSNLEIKELESKVAFISSILKERERQIEILSRENASLQDENEKLKR
jgi:hypothetical protein